MTKLIGEEQEVDISVKKSVYNLLVPTFSLLALEVCSRPALKNSLSNQTGICKLLQCVSGYACVLRDVCVIKVLCLRSRIVL